MEQQRDASVMRSQNDRTSGPTKHTNRRLLSAVLAAIVGLIILATTIATVTLWPKAEQLVQHGDVSSGGGELVDARVADVTKMSCANLGGASTEGQSTPPQGAQVDSDDCVEVRAQLPIGKSVTFTLDGRNAANHNFREGNAVRLIAHELDSGGETEMRYSFYDYPRGGKMLTIAILFAIVVFAVGRWRGVLALVGVGAAIVLLITFILPAILSGKPPVLVAIVGSVGIMVVVLYLAHGISHRTTAALFGSVFGILFTALAGLFVTRWMRFTGIASTEEASLSIAVPGLSMSDVLTATIVIAGLGILNDITVAQASAVWEMRELNPQLSKKRIYLSAMRVGRDHIASSIYTLVFAYAGAMLVMLLLLYTYPRDLFDLVTSEQIGQEIIRTLIGSAGLVLSMPVTTAFAVFFARDASSSVETLNQSHASSLKPAGRSK